jgi:tRNA1Val (adenine37-N6)-methyltransferase
MNMTFDSIRDIRLYQSKTGYRFSVDSLLLYDFVALREVSCIADLGAGSGIIGILLAKKYTGASVDLFEIQESLFKIAERNIRLNHLEDRVGVIRCDLRTLPALTSTFRSYDLVVSNPPFRKIKSGLLNIEEEKAIARHEIKMSLTEFIAAAVSLLKAKGRLCLIYHPSRLAELIDAARRKGVEPKRLRFVHSTRTSEAKMVLLEAVKGGRTGLKVERPLYIYEEGGGYTEEMKRVYGEPVGN